MQNSFKVGDRVRLIGQKQVAKVTRIVEGTVHVAYEYRPGTSTVGFYPAGHLELAEPQVGKSAGEKVGAEGDNRPAKPKASTKDILPANAAGEGAP